MADIVILGAGVMGSAMTLPGAHGGSAIDLVGTHLDEEIIRSVAGNGLHPRLGVTLPASVTAHAWTDFGAAMAKRPELLILGVSSAGVGWAIDRIVESARGAGAGPDDHQGAGADATARSTSCRTSSPARSSGAPAWCCR